jgi:hypothetical protein
MKLISCFILIICATFGFAQAQVDKGNEFSQYAFYLSEVMLHDVVNPPAASRFYAYSMLAAYQVIVSEDTSKESITQAFVHAPRFQAAPLPRQWDKTFCAIYAMLEVGRQIIPSGYLLEERQKSLIRLYRKRYKHSEQSINSNKIFAIEIANQVVDYSKTDGYSKLSTLTRYTPDVKTEGRWYPTPPEYMSAVEPHWRTIRPFFLDSARQCSPVPPVGFDTARNKPYYHLMYEVYRVTNNLTAEQRAIAAFWDCNPFAVQYSGHLAMGLKKISPGGHWLGITGIACRQSSASIEKTIEAYTLVALTLNDAFISCWDEKYRSDRIRPETAINKYLDPTWKPLLQTPPFPEYPSGHSVISTASAIVLTYLFGDNFTFKDTTEEYFGLPARNFESFAQAAEEAAISRLYGGIHFRDAIEQGQVQGRTIASYIIQKIRNKKTF